MSTHDGIERNRHQAPPISIAINHRKDDEVIDGCQYGGVKSIALIAASCPPLLQDAISAQEADQLAHALKVLADPARLRILSLIQAQPGGEACVCHLTEPLGLSQPTVSHHLKVLREAGMVSRDERGSWAYYRVLPEALEALRAVLG
jgi:ArsR family transcriptional regulator